MTHSAQVELTVIDDETALRYTESVVELYAAVYAEPPYNEGPDDVQWFAESWPSRVQQPGFRVVLARSGAELIGFTFGHQLPVDTRWWSGAQTPLPAEFTAERPGRTFAIIELAVRSTDRQLGIGRRLHRALLDGRTEERVTLLSLSAAIPAQRAYERWGYRHVARIQPGTSAPVYDCFVRDLPFG